MHREAGDRLGDLVGDDVDRDVDATSAAAPAPRRATSPARGRSADGVRPRSARAMTLVDSAMYSPPAGSACGAARCRSGRGSRRGVDRRHPIYTISMAGLRPPLSPVAPALVTRRKTARSTLDREGDLDERHDGSGCRDSGHLARAVELLRGRRIALLTGAGISTDSGIPAYRGEGAPVRHADDGRPVLLGDAARRRYWVGGHLGWRAFAAAEPNRGHAALAEMETAGVVSGVITQNVDGLHLRAGSSRVIELHGTMRRVLCLHCGQVFDRRDIAVQIEADNPWIRLEKTSRSARTATCSPRAPTASASRTARVCGGHAEARRRLLRRVRPGREVPRGRVARALQQRPDDRGLVARRELRRPSRRARASPQLPVIIINREPTRADGRATVTIDAGTSDVLPALAQLSPPSEAAPGTAVRLAG